MFRSRGPDWLRSPYGSAFALCLAAASALAATGSDQAGPPPSSLTPSIAAAIETGSTGVRAAASLPDSPALSSGSSRTDLAIDGDGSAGRVPRRAPRVWLFASIAGNGRLDLSHARAAALSRLAFATELTRASAGELAGRSTAPPPPQG